MHGDQLQRIRRTLDGMRGRLGNIRARELANLAEQLGWKQRRGGKHLTFSKEGRYPLPIPVHGGKALKKMTAKSILDQLEDDLEKEEENEGGNSNG